MKEAMELLMPAIKTAYSEMRQGQNAMVFGEDSMNSLASHNAQTLYNWLSYSGVIAFDNNPAFTQGTPLDGWGIQNAPPSENNGDKRIAKKPVDVRKQLEYEPAIWTMEGLQEKIDLLKDKSKIVTQSYSKAEIDGLIERLENRKKYEEKKDFFTKFPNTTDEKIDDLVNKYKLCMKSSDIFVPEFPKEAIDVEPLYQRGRKTMRQEACLLCNCRGK